MSRHRIVYMLDTHHYEEDSVKSMRWLAPLVVLAIAALTVAAGAFAASAKPTAKTTVALISDIGKFNDRSFNQFQLEGLNRAKAKLGVATLPLQSNSVSDYIPNLTTAVRRKADLVIAAGFLLADATNTVAAKFPDTKFAITDYPVEATPFTDAKKKHTSPNVMGLTYQANEAGCLVGYLGALMAQKQGGKQVISAVGGLKIPPVDIWIAGYRYCAKLANAKIKVLVGYSQDFVKQDLCKSQAENQIAAGSQVIFQVAGGCGLGALNAAKEHNLWGIGVDKDQSDQGPHILTSGVKRVDVGIYEAVKAVDSGTFKGGADLNFDLKNNGVAAGKISPKVPKAFIAKMNALKAKIIAGTVKVPTALK